MENSNSLNVKSINFVNERSKQLFEKRNFGLLGISTFNGYFNFNNICNLIEWGYLNFKSFKVILPGEISYYTLSALGYSQKYIKSKIRKQDNNVKNKILKSFDIINKKYSINLSLEDVIEISNLMHGDVFKTFYDKYKFLFETDINFRNGALSTSKDILNSHEDKIKIEDIEQSTQIAVNYLLYELPIFLNSPTILNVESCIMVYHFTPKFMEKLYNDIDLVDLNQGYMNVLIDVELQTDLK